MQTQKGMKKQARAMKSRQPRPGEVVDVPVLVTQLA